MIKLAFWEDSPGVGWALQRTWWWGGSQLRGCSDNSKWTLQGAGVGACLLFCGPGDVRSPYCNIKDWFSEFSP